MMEVRKEHLNNPRDSRIIPNTHVMTPVQMFCAFSQNRPLHQTAYLSAQPDDAQPDTTAPALVAHL
jgi:hypothetical protein